MAAGLPGGEALPKRVGGEKEEESVEDPTVGATCRGRVVGNSIGEPPEEEEMPSSSNPGDEGLPPRRAPLAGRLDFDVESADAPARRCGVGFGFKTG